MGCEDCKYCWKEAEDGIAFCHYGLSEPKDEPAPCEEELEEYWEYYYKK